MELSETAPGAAPVPERARSRGVFDPPLLDAEIPQDEPSRIDFRAIRAILFRNRKAILWIMGVSLSLGILSLFLLPKTWQGQASLQIDQQSSKVLGTEDSQPWMAGPDADRFMQTQIDILNSRALAKRVSDNLHLSVDNRFLETMGPVWPDDVATPALRQATVLDVLQRHLRIDMPHDSGVVNILFSSHDPVLSARIANSYANNFIDANIQRKYATTDYARSFLRSQLAEAKGRVETSERVLIDYAREAKLIDASAGSVATGQVPGPKSLVTANLVQLNAAYAEARSARVLAQQRWEQAERTPLRALPDVLANLAIQQMIQNEANLTASLEQMRQRMTPDHPTIVQARAQLTKLQEQIAALGTGIKDSIRNNFLTARRQEEALAGQVLALKQSTLSEQDRTIQYNILKREVDTSHELYDSLLQRFKEINAEAGVVANNVTVVDVAETPRRPSFPRLGILLPLAILAGLTLSLLYTYIHERIDDAIRDPRDVEAKLRIPLLGVVPKMAGTDPIAALSRPGSAIREAYHSIRTAVELSSAQGLPRTLLVTSSRPGEGKTTTAYTLARDFAGIGRRVLLIDADLRNPSLHRLVGVARGEAGFSSVLARRVTLDRAVLDTDIERLFFLPSGPLPPDPAELLGGDSLRTTMEEAAARCDLVIFDGPPVLSLADASLLTAVIDATVFVVETRRAHYGQIKHAVRRLLQAQGRLIGGVMTKYDPRLLGYGKQSEYFNYAYYNYVYNGDPERKSASK